MSVYRSSFYWYFKNRSEFLKSLLGEWENRNTRQIIKKCQTPFANIKEAICNYLQCFIGPSKFHQGFDLPYVNVAAGPSIQKRVDIADQGRNAQLTGSFIGHGLNTQDGDVCEQT